MTVPGSVLAALEAHERATARFVADLEQHRAELATAAATELASTDLETVAATVDRLPRDHRTAVTVRHLVRRLRRHALTVAAYGTDTDPGLFGPLVAVTTLAPCARRHRDRAVADLEQHAATAATAVAALVNTDPAPDRPCTRHRADRGRRPRSLIRTSSNTAPHAPPTRAGVQQPPGETTA